jgi:ABC-type nitrate/sulfonate/bicarbonate transport system substrate-binding protein
MRIVATSLLAIWALVATGCGRGRAGVADANGVFPIRTITMKDCALAPWLVTEKLGYFKQEKIRIVYTGETQPALVIPSILNGNNDVSSSHPNGLAVARAGGAKITAVFRGGIDPPPDADPRLRHMFWYVNPQKYPNVKTFADLKNIPGKLKFSTITVTICTDFLTNRLFQKAGIPLDKAEWVSMPDIQAIQALKQGLIDVAGVHPPFYKGMDDAGARSIGDSLDAGLGAAGGVGFYFFRDDFIQQHPDVVRRFIRAIGRGQAWIDQHPAQAAQWTSEAIGVRITGNHYYPLKNEYYESEVWPWIKDLEDRNVIPRGSIKPSDLITTQFVDNQSFL